MSSVDDKRKVEMIQAINMKNKRLKEGADILFQGDHYHNPSDLRKEGKIPT